MVTWTGSAWLQRMGALLIAVLAVPLLLNVSAFLQDRPVRVGEPAPRTIVAPDLIRVPDPEATDRARRDAAAGVSPVLVDDDEAKAAIVQDVRDAFARARAAREAGPDEEPPSTDEQVDALRDPLPMLSDDGLRLLVNLTDEQLAQVSSEAIGVAQQFARQRIRDDAVDRVLDEQLPTELVVRPFPGNVAEMVVDPLVRSAVRPTVAVDEVATAEARGRAADDVAEVERAFPGGSVIVSAGEVVDEVQYAALRRRGLEGSDPWRALLAAFALAAILTLAVASYLRAYRIKIWRDARRLLLLATLTLLFTASLELITIFVPTATPGWLFVIPVGAMAMLATILFDPPVGVLSTIPVTVLVAYTAPGEPGVIAFAALASLLSVPLVSRLSARGDLRRAAWQSTLGYIALAGLLAAVFGEPGTVPTALLAGLLNGAATAVIVNGSLPFMESLFGVVTATSLLDLADRNHPLLRELEQKALGSYNHSIMVSTMVERACRVVGGDRLLGSVAALYHDIGKVRRPYFFVENQFGVANPHDQLQPHVSAMIIQEHVTDGIEMARTYRLPPEVVEGIATHHGTTLVTYFYRQAVNAARNGEEIDQEAYRYKGRKPSTKEMAILMLADSCEAASRAAAQHNRNLARADLEGIVRGLVADRVEDGQLDDASLTFRELKVVQDSFIETLVGVYHPRIAYPEGQAPEAPSEEVRAPAVQASAPSTTRTIPPEG